MCQKLHGLLYLQLFASENKLSWLLYLFYIQHAVVKTRCIALECNTETFAPRQYRLRIEFSTVKYSNFWLSQCAAQGRFADPERLAFREAGPRQPLYRVRFSQVRPMSLSGLQLYH